MFYHRTGLAYKLNNIQMDFYNIDPFTDEIIPPAQMLMLKKTQQYI
jgi:hypothetical protein